MTWRADCLDRLCFINFLRPSSVDHAGQLADRDKRAAGKGSERDALAEFEAVLPHRTCVSGGSFIPGLAVLRSHIRLELGGNWKVINGIWSCLCDRATVQRLCTSDLQNAA